MRSEGFTGENLTVFGSSLTVWQQEVRQGVKVHQTILLNCCTVKRLLLLLIFARVRNTHQLSKVVWMSHSLKNLGKRALEWNVGENTQNFSKPLAIPGA